MDLDPSIREKEAFYAQIDSLESPLKDEDEDLSCDLDLRKQSQALFARLQRANKRKASQPKDKPPNLTEQISTPQSLTRATTFPVATSGRASTTIVKATPFAAKDSNQQHRQDQCPSSASFVEDTPFQNTVPSVFSGLQRSATTPGALSSMIKSVVEQSPSIMSSTNTKARAARGRPKGMGKTKAEVLVPENEQIFKGLRFYYMPQERISLRRQRMEGAEKFGAVVTEKLLDCTHVIVDKELKYDQIKPFIAPILGKNGPVITGYLWPLDCIKAKRILPVKEKYFVWGMQSARGHPVASGVQQSPPTATQASDKSLQVKVPRKNPDIWDHVPSHTPSQSDASPVQHPDKRKAESISLELDSSQETGQENLVIPSSQAPPEQEDQDIDAEKNTREHRPVSSGEGDELSQLISRVREEFKDLPRLEEDDAFPSPDGEEDGDDTDEEPKVKKRRKSGGKKSSPKSSEKKNLAEYFVCNRGGTKDQASRQDNPNARTIAVLQQMLAYYEQTNNHWRLRAYRNAINTLSRTPVMITTADEAEELQCFGKSLAQKLEEIVNTNTLRRLKYVQNDPTSQVLTLFLGIYGVGKTTADKWIAKGFRTLEDLVQKADLNPNQRVGIEHYNDLNTRIPRTEVTKIGDFVQAEASRIDGDVKLLVGGSYRRGADSSGDVDFIITKPGTTSSDDLVPFLEKLVGNLTKMGFLTAELAAHNFGRDDGGSKWHGCCVLPPPEKNPGGSSNPNRSLWRRIDFLLVPEIEYGAALIYFTGNDIFNRSIRLLASKKGMRLNQRGLYKDVLRTAYGRQKITTGELIEGRDERRIFEILGVKWREPEERWC